MIKDFINEKRFKGEKLVPYLGIDATAASLHVGHLIPLLAISKYETPYILVGTETAMIGDPTGKTEQRQKLDMSIVSSNRDSIIAQVRKLIPSANIVENSPLNLNEISDFISINKLIKYQIFANRLADGNNLSLSEMIYPVRQANDFLNLNRKYGVNLQVGGSDQYTNILAGIDLIRAIDKVNVFGKTTHLLNAKSGKKISKSEGGAVYLTDDPFKVWHFFRNIKDTDLPIFGGDIPIDAELINQTKVEIAGKMVSWYFGEDIATQCELMAKIIYK
jgi:tyrosyl-tRNA synthetase